MSPNLDRIYSFHRIKVKIVVGGSEVSTILPWLLRNPLLCVTGWWGGWQLGWHYKWMSGTTNRGQSASGHGCCCHAIATDWNNEKLGWHSGGRVALQIWGQSVTGLQNCCCHAIAEDWEHEEITTLPHSSFLLRRQDFLVNSCPTHKSAGIMTIRLPRFYVLRTLNLATSTASVAVCSDANRCQQTSTDANRHRQTPQDTDKCCLSTSRSVHWQLLLSLCLSCSLKMSEGCLWDIWGYLSDIRGNRRRLDVFWGVCVLSPCSMEPKHHFVRALEGTTFFTWSYWAIQIPKWPHISFPSAFFGDFRFTGDKSCVTVAFDHPVVGGVW